MLFGSLLFFGAVLTAFAHPADESERARVHRKRHSDDAIKKYESCQNKLINDEEMQGRRFAKRELWIDEYSHRKGIKRRDLGLRTIPLEERQVSCVLAPEVTIGPYYLDRMPIRQDVREGEPGVQLLLEMQFINVNNCQPVEGAYVDIWQANSTGKYAGFQVEGTLGETQLRGLQPTDSDGIARFTTTWPGHYQGRAVHTHILVHWGGRVVNGYYTGGTRPHIGQLFYDQGMISQVAALSPYSTNNAFLIPNILDFIYWQQSAGYDSIVKTQLLGASIGSGVTASIVVGIDI